ncbi:putative cullin [Rosa chinensis]|uniref:Putative cullin n=1 Tax=Rosa chinensis TaxID=74649 RepID=A0A2P6QCB6_ROSCH|nr:putative cullin [Rosa chinensis]
MGPGSPIDFDQGWDDIEWAIVKLTRILEGLPETPFDAEYHIYVYSTVCNMCDDHSHQVYEACRETIEAYNTEIVLPSLADKHGALLLRELVRRWRNNKALMRWLWRFFIVLDQYYVEKAKVPGIKQAGIIGFRDEVYEKVKENVGGAVMGMINEEREGGLIDRGLLKDVVEIFVKMGIYEADCEEEMMRE